MRKGRQKGAAAALKENVNGTRKGQVKREREKKKKKEKKEEKKRRTKKVE